jgi:3-oxoacyl-[acyl-carrier protein] reductase
MTFQIDLSGRRALVTGSGQGVGRAIALALAEAGARVYVNDIDAGRAGGVAGEVDAAGGAAEAAVFDVTDFDGVHAALERIGGVDILVNNAGNAGAERFDLAPFALSSPGDWERYLNVNLYGVMHCVHAALPHMTDSGFGRVVTIVSDAARWGESHMAAYAAAKAGAAGFMRAIAREVGRYGVTVNSIALGSMLTPMTAAGAGVEGRDESKALRQYIIRRRGLPEDVAPMVALLSSPLASWITGQTIPINGGYTVNL